MRVAGFALKRHAIRCVQRYTCTGLGSVRCRTHRDRSPLQTFLSNPFRRESRSQSIGYCLSVAPDCAYAMFSHRATYRILLVN